MRAAGEGTQGRKKGVESQRSQREGGWRWMEYAARGGRAGAEIRLPSQPKHPRSLFRISGGHAPRRLAR